MDEETQRAVAGLLAIMERVKVANNTPYQVYGMSFVNVLKWKIL